MKLRILHFNKRQAATPNGCEADSPVLRAGGFTLIEVMLAIGIFALLVSAIFGSWTAILRSAKFGISAATQAQRTRISMRALEESLGGAVLTAGTFHITPSTLILPGLFPFSVSFRICLRRSPVLECTTANRFDE